MNVMDPKHRFFTDEELATVVERAAGARVGEYVCEPFGGVVNASATGGVWRVRSNRGNRRSAEGGRRSGDWSVIVKILRHSDAGHRLWLSSADPLDPMYWRREAFVLSSGLFEDGLFDDLGLKPPRFFGSFEAEDGRVRLWMEDVAGIPGVEWDVSRYCLAARHIGELQGRFLAGAPLPKEPWWSRGWLRAYVERRRESFATALPPEVTRDPLVKLAFPEDVSDRVALAWNERHRVLDALDRLPQTLCHEDYWSKNLFQRTVGSSTETVAIDWAFTGIGAPGEDAAVLAFDALFDFFVSAAEHTRAMFEGVFEGYLEGLKSAGARLTRDEARFGFCAAVSTKYLWGCRDLLFIAMDKAAQERVQKRMGISLEKLYVDRGVVLRYLLDLADEARALMPHT